MSQANNGGNGKQKPVVVEKVSRKRIDELLQAEKDLAALRAGSDAQPAKIGATGEAEVKQALLAEVKRLRAQRDDDRAVYGEEIAKNQEKIEKNFTNAQANKAYGEYVPDFNKVKWNWVSYMTLHMGNLFNVSNSRLRDKTPWLLVIAGIVGFFLFYAYTTNPANAAGIAAWESSGWAAPEILILLAGAGYVLYRFHDRLGF